MSPAATKKKTAITVPTTAITISTDLPSTEEGEKTEAFWVGTMPDCPLPVIYAGGIAFPRFTGDHITAGGDLIPESRLSHGIIVHLGKAQLNTVKEGIRLRVLRFLGVDRVGDEFEDAEGTPKRKRKQSACIVMRDSKKLCRPGHKYTAQVGDEPAARYVYMHRAEDMSMLDKRNWPPHSMEAPKEE